MDDARFDDLTRRLLGVGGRRQLLRGLTVALGGGAAALAGSAVAADRKKRRRRKRRKRRERGDDPEPPNCSDSQVLCGDECVRGACCPGEVCGGNCRCLTSTDADAFCAKNAIVPCVACPVDGCGAGKRCVPAACGEGTICVPECGT